MNSFEAKNTHEVYTGVQTHLKHAFESIENLKETAAQVPLKTARVMVQQGYREARDKFPFADQFLYRPHLDNLNLLEKNPEVLKNLLEFLELF